MNSFERETKMTMNAMDGEQPKVNIDISLITIAGNQAFLNALDCVKLLDAKQLDSFHPGLLWRSATGPLSFLLRMTV